MSELARLIRHGVSPFVTYLVVNGWLPEYMQGDVTEALVIGVSFAVPYAISRMRDVKRAN